jgi:hypothetical protein
MWKLFFRHNLIPKDKKLQQECSGTLLIATFFVEFMVASEKRKEKS